MNEKFPQDLLNDTRIHMYLPTFAGDYSGVASALFELDGTIIFHDPAGCTGNFVGYDEPRAYSSHARVFTSALDDMQALFGRDDLFVEASAHTQEAVGGRFVAIIGSPNPMILGTDLKALGKELQRKIHTPVLAFETTGTRYYDYGVSLAMLKLARDLVFPNPKPRSQKQRHTKSVNLLGATPLDLLNNENVQAIKDILEDAGWAIESCWCMGSSLDELAEAQNAACNVVLTRSGHDVAAWMNQALGIPYIDGSLSGEKPVQRFLRNLEMVAEGKPAEQGPKATGGHDRALVIGEQVLANSIRQSLIEDMGFAKVETATFFDWDQPLSEGDHGTISELQALDLAGSGNYDLVVGDGLLEPYVSEGTVFVEVPHAAVSSRLSWDKHLCPYGISFLKLVDHAFVKKSAS